MWQTQSVLTTSTLSRAVLDCGTGSLTNFQHCLFSSQSKSEKINPREKKIYRLQKMSWQTLSGGFMDRNKEKTSYEHIFGNASFSTYLILCLYLFNVKKRLGNPKVH